MSDDAEHVVSNVTWYTITELVNRDISRYKIMYWLPYLQSQELARKTGDRRCDPWLIHSDAIEFLTTKSKSGRKRKEISETECTEWRRVYALKWGSVQATAEHFGVVWQTAARRLDSCGIRAYVKKPKGDTDE